jgi:hypothetical protein
MTFNLIDAGWDRIFDLAVRRAQAEFRIICPFIKETTAKRLLLAGRPDSIKVITRFNLQDFCGGVSDISALCILLNNGAQIRGVKNLHAKLYLFGKHTVIATSANLTEAALIRNHEFGFLAEDSVIFDTCSRYFDRYWKQAGSNLTPNRVDEWQRLIAPIAIKGSRPSDQARLPDEGVKVGLLQPVIFDEAFGEASQSFVKIFGRSDNRAERSMLVLEEVERSGSHWACTYPKGRRPRQVQDRAVMFMGRLVKQPDDILIYGRAFGQKYNEGRDDATSADIHKRRWKAKWPHYIRVHNAEFVSGILTNGISLNELMATLGYNSFAATQRNKNRGKGNQNPRRAYSQKPSVELTSEAFSWLNENLEAAFLEHGKLTPAELEILDWPTLSAQGGFVQQFISILPPKGRRLLRTLVQVLKSGSINLRDTKTYPSYKEIIQQMGIKPRSGRALGRQFRTEGGDELNNWLGLHRLPAFTGLIVRSDNHLPGRSYFVSNKRHPNDTKWWETEMEKSAKFDWSSYLD